MRVLLALGFLPLFTAASSFPFLVSKPTGLLQITPHDIAAQYREDSSKGFYSYGYRGLSAAKAEYTSADGSSKGFYSYVDADGKLQTVKYEASKNAGFKASVTNLPIQPIDNSKAPVPVKETPQVQMAKQAHFEAFREAARLAAQSPDGDSNVKDDIEIPKNRNKGIEEESNMCIDQQLQALGLQNAQTSHTSEIGQIAMNGQFDDVSTILTDVKEDSSQSNVHQHMTTYTLKTEIPNVEEESGFSQLAHLNDPQHFEASIANSYDEVRVPVHSYVTVLSPATKYTVVSPTIHTTVPRIESIKLGQSLPISLSSSFVSQRIRG